MLIMLSLEQYQIIKNELAKETAKEFVNTLLDMYANNVENVSDLLSYIPQLAEKQLAIKQTVINQYAWSTDLLICDRHLHPHKYKKNEWNNQFCTLLYTCKAHFKSGNANGQSKACETFFNEFIEVLKEKKEFDYTNKEDWEWMYTSAGCADWLEKVIQQNIDNDFIKPECMVRRKYGAIL